MLLFVGFFYYPAHSFCRLSRSRFVWSLTPKKPLPLEPFFVPPVLIPIMNPPAPQQARARSAWVRKWALLPLGIFLRQEMEGEG